MSRAPELLVPGLLALACVAGGGGGAYGLVNLTVQLAALLVLALAAPAVGRFVRSGPRLLQLLMVLTLALPLAQLVPLPPSVWQALPGRELVAESLATIGRDGEWRAFSVDSGRTLVAFFGLLVPFTMIAVGWSLDPRGLARLPLVVAAVALAGLLLGIAQVFGTDQFGLLYPENPFPGVLFGFFANRNSTGVFLVCALQLCFALPPARAGSLAWLAKLGTAALLVTGVVMTQSRSSLALLAVPAGFAVLRAVALAIETRQSDPRAATLAVRNLLAGALALGLAVAVIVPLAAGGRLATTLDRFDAKTDERAIIWEDARFAAERYWPAGAGMGTFDEVFQVDESLEYVSPRRAGRAHNDYLEIAIEAGLPGIALVGGWALWILVALVRAVLGPRRWIAIGAGGGLLVIGLQSILDYPLRNETMMAVAGTLVLLLARCVVPLAAPAGGPRA